jgi:hypothetical protein
MREHMHSEAFNDINTTDESPLNKPYVFPLVTLISLGTSALFLIPSAHATASLLPFSTSTQNQMTSEAQKHNAKRKGNPIQLLPDLSMMACMTMGPIMEDARFESPKRPKNCNYRDEKDGTLSCNEGK